MDQTKELIARIEALHMLIGQKDELILHLQRSLSAAQQQAEPVEPEADGDVTSEV